MPQGIIVLAVAPNFCLAASGTSINSPLVLGERNVTPNAQILWDYNAFSRQLTLVRTGSHPLVATAPNCGANTKVVLNEVSSSNPLQQWELLLAAGGTTIDCVGCPGQCLDVEAAVYKAGTPIILYPRHSGNNQIWNFLSVTQAEVEAAF
ncbi:RICIN domain-containing protein [Azospirillum sp. B4]|uniref:RICIN domain-containing protein n=1 Tax=Azospirillum sp. B4 TaxID=95605 RepID=UPI0003483C03|nr:RICIN domain-containing protein [Azospirillum sp. B4]